MAKEDSKSTLLITEPGILALGAGLPSGPSIQSYFSGETVKQVACGYDHSVVVCDSGKVFIFGKNQYNGWMEIGSNTVTAPSPLPALATVRVTQAACGKQFTVFLTDKGKLYACGENNYGQLGLGHTDKKPSPVLVTGLPPIKKVAAAVFHTVALAFTGEVWVTGYNADGQLGLGHTNNISSFIVVPNLKEAIVDISCGDRITALLSVSHAILMTGSNENGKLGLGSIDSISSFKQVSVPSSAVAAMTCGVAHTVALRADRTVWSFGLNSCGQLSTGDKDNMTTPTQINGLERHTITKVFAGGHHTALLTDQGDVLVCGRGTSGELGQGKEDLCVATLLSKSPALVVKQIAFAWSYTLILVVPKTYISPTVQMECESTLKQDLVARGSFTDWERCFMKSVGCPVCFKIMCRPIHMCLNGHSLCNTCRLHSSTTVCPLCQEVFGQARNLALESQTEDIHLPCLDCLLRMPACKLEEHSTVCPNREYTCPLERSCGWTGRPDTMLAHTTSAHPDQTWTDLPHLFLHPTSDDLEHTNVLAAHNQVFTLHRRFSQATGEFRAVVRFIGLPEHKDKFKFELNFFSNNDETKPFIKNICADIESVEEAFQSSNCVLMTQKSVHKFLQRCSLVCQVTIVKVETNNLADRIKALWSA